MVTIVISGSDISRVHLEAVLLTTTSSYTPANGQAVLLPHSKHDSIQTRHLNPRPTVDAFFILADICDFPFVWYRELNRANFAAMIDQDDKPKFV